MTLLIAGVVAFLASLLMGFICKKLLEYFDKNSKSLNNDTAENQNLLNHDTELAIFSRAKNTRLTTKDIVWSNVLTLW